MARRPSVGSLATQQRASQYKAANPKATTRQIQAEIGGRRQDVVAGSRLASSESGRYLRTPPELRAASEGGTRGYKHTVFSREVVGAVIRAKATPTKYLRARYERTKEQASAKPGAQRKNESGAAYSARWAAWRKGTTQPWADRQELVKRIGEKALKGKAKITKGDRLQAVRRLGEQALGEFYSKGKRGK